MNWNISAWSIRQPVPSLVLFMVLIDARLRQLRAAAGHALSQHRHPDRAGARHQSGAAPSELETQVTKKIEDAIAGVNGVKHITSTVTDGSSHHDHRVPAGGQPGPRAQRRQGRDRRASAPSCRAPSTSRSSSASRSRACRSSPTRPARPGMTPEQLSWFVDDIVVRALQGVKGVVAGRAHRRRRPRDPRRARSRPAARLRHHRRRRQPAAARDQRRPRRRPRRDRRPRAGDPHARRQADGGGPRRAPLIALPGGRKVRLDELGTVTDATAEPRTFAALDGKPVVAFAISRAKGASDVVGGRRRRPRRSPSCRSHIPNVSSSTRSTPRSTTRSAPTTRPWRR